MAEGKKSVLLYCDIIHTVEKLDDETAGKLFKHYLRYINDEHPETDDLLVEVSFEPMKQNLKRDLVKWEERAKRSQENGKKGGRPRTQTNPEKPSGLNGNPDEPKEPDTVNVKGNVTDTVKETKKKEEALLIFPFESDDFKNMWELWKDYRHKQHQFKYKHVVSEQAALKKLNNLCGGKEDVAIGSIEHTMSNGWKDFYLPKNDNNGKSRLETFAEASRSRDADALFKDT